MKLDRYVFSEVMWPSLLGLGFYTFVLIMNQLFLVVRQAMQRGSAVSTIIQLLALALPKILVLTIPMALLLGVLIGLGRLSADSEVVAMRASGMSYVRMARPVLALGLIGFAATGAIYNIAVPWTNARIETLRLELLRTTDPNREIHAGVFYDEIPDTLLYAEQVIREDPVWPLRKVFIETDRYDPTHSTLPEREGAAPEGGPDTGAPPEPAGRPEEGSGTETLVCGARGRVEMAPDGSQVTFVIDRGEIHHNKPDAPLAYQMFRFQKPMITVVPLSGPDPFGESRGKSLQEMTLRELLEEVRLMRSAPDWQESPARSVRVRRALVEMNWRFSVPAAALVFCILAFPLGLINHRGGKASGFAISLIVILLYWVALQIGGKLAAEGRISPIVGTWAPNLFVLAAAIALLLVRQKRDVFSLPTRTRAWARSMQSRVAASAGPLPAPEREPRPDPVVFTTTPAPRIRFALIDIYLGKRYLKIFGLVLLSAATIYSIVELKSLVDSLLQRSLPTWLALEYLVFFAPGMMKVVMPVAAVVAALITLGTLCSSNEDTALKAAGVSIFRISAPVLIVTIGLCLVYFLMQDYLAPVTNQRASRIRDKIEGRVSSATVAGTRWVFGKDSRLYGFAEYDAAKRALQGVTVIDFAQSPFGVRRRLWSPRVRWTNDTWVATSGWSRSFEGESETYATLLKTSVPWPETPDDFERHERSLMGSDRLAEEMNFFSLRRHINKLKDSGLETTRLRVSLYDKLAFPAAPLVMVMIGLPFGFRTGRRGSLYGLGIALVLIIVYWSCFAVSSALGEDGILPPIIAAWSPNLLFALAGSYLFLSTRS